MKKAACTLNIEVQAAFWVSFEYLVDGVVDVDSSYILNLI